MTTNHIYSFLSFFWESEEVRDRNQPYLTGELKNNRANFSWDIHISPRNKSQNVQKWQRWSAYKFPHTTVSSVSVFEYRMCWENKPAPAPIALQDLPCVISLHVLNGWVVTDIWCEFDVNLIFRNILEKPRKLVMCSIFRFPTSSFGPLEWRANTQYKLTCLRLRWILFFICIQTNDSHSVKPTQSQFWLTVPNTCTHKI